MATLAALTTSLRQLIRDNSDDHSSFQEKPNGANDGTNAVFQLLNRNIVAGTLYFDVGATTRTQTGFTLSDAVNGVVTFAPAPAANSNPFQCYYYYQWFVDAKLQEFLAQAAETLGYGTDATKIVDGLIAASMQLGAALAFQARASEFAERFSSSGGVAGQSVATVAAEYRAQAKLAFDKGMALQKNYWDRQSQKLAPASGTVTMGIDPFTPLR